MKRLALLAVLCAAGTAQADDGFTLGIGADYSTGDYGTATTTEIWSLPLTAKLTRGDWTFKASLPWLHVSGDPDVLPGVGNVVNLNPRGRGRGGVVPAPQTGERSTASGLGDLRLSATYAFPTEGPFGVDLTANVKIATADEDAALGTGANDYGLALDLYRSFDTATVFGGVGYTRLGDSDFIDVDSVLNANLGASWTAGPGSLGLMYDWREAASSEFDDRSELTGFYTVPAGESGKWQFYALKGLSDGSPDWGGGVSYQHGF